MSQQESERVRLLRDILKWIKFSGMKGVKEVLDNALNTEQKKIVYQLSDGSKPSLEIGRTAKCSEQTVRNYWKLWLKQSLGETISVRGGDRFKRSFDLGEFGIELPEIPDATVAQRPTTPPPTEKHESGQTELVPS